MLGGGAFSTEDMLDGLMPLRIKALRAMLKEEYAAECKECKTKEHFVEKIVGLEKAKRANQLGGDAKKGAQKDEL
jgi:hypothetical protein